MSNLRSHIMVCGGTGCKSSESDRLVEILKKQLEEKGYAEEVEVLTTGCFGFCGQGPIVKVHPDNVFYVLVKPEDAMEIVDEHIVKGRKVERLLYQDPDRRDPRGPQQDRFLPEARVHGQYLL